MSVPIAHALLPHATTIPDGVSIDSVLADLADDGVSAPASDVDGLRDVVIRAEDHGIKLSVVVVDKDPARAEYLRDLASEVGQSEGGTVLVLSPSSPGTYSDTVSRVVLEGAQDHTYTGNAVQSANNFVDEITDSGTPWALITALLVLVVVLVGGASYVAKVRRGPDATTSTPTAAVPSAGSDLGGDRNTP
ncbi:DUF6676 domain-containing protein [Prescottella defluvii]|uniref:Rv1476 family membrane protein n=1 Tax=Prescottella defluvii TaxID=1323361 RepID=UPI00068E211C|nr:DUF6676 family protein [Prescottella defluvii]